MNDAWVLLAEDDKLFATLFGRFWRESCPEVPLIQVASVSEARVELQNRPSPLVAVLDYTLLDGTSEEISTELECPFLVWSACGTDSRRAKPNGRAELGQAVRQVAEMAGLVPLE